MKWSAAARFGILISALSTLSACGVPAMAQVHRGGGHPAAPHTGGQMPHMGNGGMHQVPPHVQQQMQHQMQIQMQQMHQHQQQMRQQAHQQYQKDLQQFDQWLRANGHAGNGSAAGRLPKDPAAFDAWAANQKKLKAQGKRYDSLYDHFRSFADSAGSNGSQGGRSGSGQAHANGKTPPQAGAAGSMGHNPGTAQGAKKGGATHDPNSRTAQGTDSGGSTHDAKSAAAQQKHAEARREEQNRLARREREEAVAGRNRTQQRHVQGQDQAKVSLLRTVQPSLQQPDHDYDGNRVRAMESVSQAIHHLGAAGPMGFGGGSSLAGISGAGDLPQGQSDGILRDAIYKLRTVEGQLGTSGSGASHHAEARASVSQAIHHLEVALRVR